jgi:hypothetical protein
LQILQGEDPEPDSLDLLCKCGDGFRGHVVGE